MIDAALRATLDAVAAMLAGEPDPWWIIGSAAVVLHGADTAVADVDLLTSAAAARRLADGLGIDPVARPDARFRSTVFLVRPGSTLPIEVMGGLAVGTGDEWVPLRPETRARAATDPALFVPARAELVAILRLFGRAKDRARAALLSG